MGLTKEHNTTEKPVSNILTNNAETALNSPRPPSGCPFITSRRADQLLNQIGSYKRQPPFSRLSGKMPLIPLCPELWLTVRQQMLVCWLEDI